MDQLIGVPGISIPCGFDQDGMPLGLHITSRAWDEQSALDVAMNAQGSTLEQRDGRSILSSLHGLWSLGSMGGAAIGGLAAGWTAGGPTAVDSGAGFQVRTGSCFRVFRAGPLVSDPERVVPDVGRVVLVSLGR